MLTYVNTRTAIEEHRSPQKTEKASGQFRLARTTQHQSQAVTIDMGFPIQPRQPLL
ncbi:hypothetical protein QUB56_25470 [Microcoleus sp. AR_TQ3_B6]|uniref:hypothetical protein n=1 Tax=Microcoleus sp. AR_TQ3_B6 TaxID=3055284 RepID=UPI002FD66493